MAKKELCRVSDLAVGRLTPVSLGRARLVVTLLPDGGVRAVAARCPHQGADLEHGHVADLVEGEAPNEIRVAEAASVLRCPWHGFEYCLHSGAALVEGPEGRRLRLRVYQTTVEDGAVMVEA